MDTKLKIEPGKFYRTRDGRKAWVGCDLRQGGVRGHDYPFVGALDGDYETWQEDGCYLRGEQQSDDLVAEWIEPKRIRLWVNIFASKSLTRNGGLVTAVPSDGRGA